MHLAFKVLYIDRTPCSGGSGTYPLPGEWHEEISLPRKCRSGYHVVPLKNLGTWYSDARENQKKIWLVEVKGPFDSDGDKVACANIRLIRPLKLSARALKRCAKLLCVSPTMYSVIYALLAYGDLNEILIKCQEIIARDLRIPIKAAKLTTKTLKTTKFGLRNGRVPRAKKSSKRH